MYQYKVVQVIKVIDGDTVEITLDLGFNIHTKQKIRISGINTPELKSKVPEEKIKAEKAKDFAQKWFDKHSRATIIVSTTKEDKYGRVLGDFYVEGGPSFSEEMLKEDLAVVYLP